MAVDATLAALADPHRRHLFERLRERPAAVGELADRLPITRAAVSQHLKVLLDAGLVSVETQGRHRVYRARVEGLDPLLRYLHGEAESPTPATPPVSDPVAQGLHKWQREAPHIDASLLALLMYFAQVGQYVWRSNEEVAASVGLRFSDITVMGALRRLGPPYESTPTQLSHTFWITLPGMTKRLSKLEGLGLIERAADPDDGRSVVIRLTAKGLATLRQLVAHKQPPEYYALADLAPEEREALLRLLPRLLQGIDERHGRRRPPYIVRS